MSADAAPGSAARRPLDEQVHALRRLALVATRPAGPEIFQELVEEVARALDVAAALVAVFANEQRTTMRTLAAVFGGKAMPPIEYLLARSPCVEVVGKGYCFMRGGVKARYGTDRMVAEFGLDAYAAFPMSDSAGEPLGLVAVLDPRTIAGGDADHAEAVLKIAAVRLAAELERCAASAALQRSEASYRAIFEAAEDCIFVHEWDSGRFIDVNPKACSTYGYPREELLRLTVGDVSSGVPPYTAQDAARWMNLARDGRCPPFEWQRRNKDGSLHWDEVRLKPVTIDGRPHMLAVTRDITEHKAAEGRLRDSEAQYRAIFNASADVLTLWNSQYRRVDVNPAYERLYGWKREEVIGRGFDFPAYSDDHRQLRERLLRRALAGETVQAEHDVVTRSGERRHAEVTAIPFRHGDEPHVLVITRDITERTRAQAALRASEEQYRAIFNASADALILWNSRFERVDVNAAYERMYGWSREEVIGRGYDRPEFTPQYVAPRRELVQRALAGETCSAVLEALRKDGTTILTEVQAIPFTHRGEPHVLAIARDLTAQRAAQAERVALEAQLRQAQKMEAIGQLTGGIAHDFNNILTSVIGYLVLAQEHAERLADATLARQLGAAQSAAQRARDLIAQMLAFARRQRGDRRVIALAPVVRQALQLLRSTLPASIALDDVAAGAALSLPPVRGDAVQLEQVLFNLCLNARDAMARGGRITVRLAEHRGAAGRCASCGIDVAGGHWLRLSVSDTGSGIDPGVVPRMFEPFFTTKEVGRGSGMGLAMAHGIVHEHGGHIVVDTASGRGSTFQILLPATADSALDARPAGAPVSAAGAPLAGRVMVVEDEPMVAAFMQELLSGWGLEVVLPEDAHAAMRWFDEPAHQVDLLITDLTMPQLSGLDLAHHVSVQRPELPVLLYSGDPDAVDADALRRAGVRAVLGKPVDPSQLAATLRRWLGAR